MLDSKNWFDFLKVTLVSPTQIKLWGTHFNGGTKILGEIKTEELISPETLKPAINGLFCEKIFGPVNKNECTCGALFIINKLKRLECTFCNIKKDLHETRKFRMGFIQLCSPVIHIWYLSGITCYISLLLNISLKTLENIIYLNDDLKFKSILQKYSKNLTFKYFNSKYDDINTGTNIIQKLLNNLNLQLEAFRSRLMLYILTIHKSTFPILDKHKNLFDTRSNILKRLRVIENFISTKSNPSWMILTCLPVIPPLVRPLLPDNNSKLLISDLNNLYLNIIKINNNLVNSSKYSVPRLIIKNERRQLQEAVNLLIDKNKNSFSKAKIHNLELKSLSKNLQGKTGRFRYNILGKRVNYSGRSVIIVGPFLKLNQCGLPLKMAIHIFEPFLIHQLIRLKITHTIIEANKFLMLKNYLLLIILQIIIKQRVILLNRAPTLHRLGIQGFKPIIILGHAIKLHPLVCNSFNADFDGDQISVHVPLTLNSQREIKKTIYTPNNFLSPTTGLPTILPSHDMIIGYNILSFQEQSIEKYYFKTYQNLINAYYKQQITLNTVIWFKKPKLSFCNSRIIKIQFDDSKKLCTNKFFATTLGRIILNQAVYKNLEI